MASSAENNIAAASREGADALTRDLPELSAEDAERFASAFIPSWEYEGSSFAAGAGLAHGEMEALSNGGLQADFRGTSVTSSSPPRPPPARVETHEPEHSVIIDRAIASTEMVADTGGFIRRDGAGGAGGIGTIGGISLGALQPGARGSQHPSASSQAETALGRQRASALDTSDFQIRTKSRKGLWFGLGVVVAVIGGIVVLQTATSGESSESTARAAGASPSASIVTTEHPPGPPPTPGAQAAVNTVTPSQLPVSAPDAVRSRDDGVRSGVAAPRPSPAVAAAPPPVQRHVSPPPRPIVRQVEARPAPRPAAPAARPVARPAPAAGGIVRENPF